MPRPHLTLDPAGLCPPTERALIGVSGGRDSVALLHALWREGFQQLVVCHWDHAWREESAADAAFVSRFAQALGYPSVAGRADGTAAAKEAIGRAQRLDFFARTARDRRCSSIYLAHHADDQVETFLLHLLRGAGSGGLGAMAPRTSQRMGETELILLRPLLGTWRREIDAYLVAEGLEHREDPSNADPQYTRNRYRHHLLPLLEQSCGHDLRQVLWRTAEILAAEDEYLTQLPEVQPAGDRLAVARVRALPLALQRRLVRHWLLRAGVLEPSFAEVESVRLLAKNRFPAKVNLSGDRHARRREGCIFLETAPSPRRPA